MLNAIQLLEKAGEQVLVSVCLMHFQGDIRRCILQRRFVSSVCPVLQSFLCQGDALIVAYVLNPSLVGSGTKLQLSYAIADSILDPLHRSQIDTE